MYILNQKIGTLLVNDQKITEEQLNSAQELQRESNHRLSDVLIEAGFVTGSMVMETAAKFLGMPFYELRDVDLDKELAKKIPRAIAEMYRVIPLKLESRVMTVAMADPTNVIALDDVSRVTGYQVLPVLFLESDIAVALNQLYCGWDDVEKSVDKMFGDEEAALADRRTIVDEEDAPIVNIVNSIITRAIDEMASDIHIEPQEVNVRVRYRLDGLLREIITFPKSTQNTMISRVKIMAELNITERRLPQDGRIVYQYKRRMVDLRVSVLPTVNGEKICMRILDKEATVVRVERLGMGKSDIASYKELYQNSDGMILVTGPTGCGKSTTLYATIHEINVPDKNIVTIEDPVELQFEGLNQVMINSNIGLTFASVLRSILRQDPNVIMVGEIRDTETADIAVRAAMTGHMVLSSLHTNSAPGALTRLMDMGVEPFVIASAVRGVVAQRLVRLICVECKEAYSPEPESTERVFLNVSPEAPIKLFRGVGCKMCGFTGYKGRTGIYEVMAMSPKLRSMVNKNVTDEELVRVARDEGMTSMREDGVNKIYAGLTTVQEVVRVSFADDEE
ncbi:MAG: ATPase, T2SS/T4P/T4SS family [Negativicutes bacterium]|jgi:type IV pilus assembly protein PilB